MDFPLYYPYHVPHPPIAPIPHPFQQRIFQLQRQNELCRLAQSEAAIRANQEMAAQHNYARSILINSKIESQLNHQWYDYQRNSILAKTASTAVQYNYLKKIDQLRREREMLQYPQRISCYQRIPDSQILFGKRDERFMSDEQLVNYYHSGAKGQDYHKQLSKQLQTRYQSSNSPNKYSKTQRSGYKVGRDQLVQMGREGKDKQEQAIKRSYIDELNNSTGHGNSSDKGFQRSKKQYNRGETIDVVSRDESSPVKNNYLYKSKMKKPVNSMNSTINISGTKPHFKKKSKNNISYRETSRVGFSSQISQSALKKINNRLKLSEIVYKDSKLRHAKHEAQHLLNTYQNEVKGRKKIKQKLNNHPFILKKHSMVVDS